MVQGRAPRIGLRSVEVKGGHLYLNNRRIELRGASIHEDMPGSGAALTGADMDRIVADLKDLGANVTREHYLMNERLLDRLRPRRDHGLEPGADLAARPRRAAPLAAEGPARALLTVKRTVTAARSHPSVLTHSVANELSFTPDQKPGTQRFLLEAQEHARATRPDAADLGRHQGPTRLRRAVHLPPFDLIG